MLIESVSSSYNTLISNSVSFTCISAGQTPISPQISAGLETFHEYCIDRLGDHDDSTTTRNSLPTSTGASPASRSPGPTVGPDSAAQAGSSGSSNRSVVLGCAIGISIGIVLIASIIGILMWPRRKTRPSGNMPTTNPDGLDFSQANTGPYEAPSDHQRRPLPQADEKAELPGQELSRTELLAVPTDAYPPQYTPRARASAGRGITRHEMPVNERSVELEGDRENVVPSPPTPKRPGTEPFTGLG